MPEFTKALLQICQDSWPEHRDDRLGWYVHHKKEEFAKKTQIQQEAYNFFLILHVVFFLSQ